MNWIIDWVLLNTQGTAYSGPCLPQYSSKEIADYQKKSKEKEKENK